MTDLASLSAVELLQVAEHRLAAERRAADHATVRAAEIVFRDRPEGWNTVVDRPLRPGRKAIAATVAWFLDELPELDVGVVFEVAIREGTSPASAAAGLRDGLIEASAWR